MWFMRPRRMFSAPPMRAGTRMIVPCPTSAKLRASHLVNSLSRTYFASSYCSTVLVGIRKLCMGSALAEEDGRVLVELHVEGLRVAERLGDRHVHDLRSAQ